MGQQKKIAKQNFFGPVETDVQKEIAVFNTVLAAKDHYFLSWKTIEDLLGDTNKIRAVLSWHPIILNSFPVFTLLNVLFADRGGQPCPKKKK